MSERSARLFERGSSRFESAEEAWDALAERRNRLDWDLEAVRIDPHTGTENRYRLSASDD